MLKCSELRVAPKIYFRLLVVSFMASAIFAINPEKYCYFVAPLILLPHLYYGFCNLESKEMPNERFAQGLTSGLMLAICFFLGAATGRLFTAN